MTSSYVDFRRSLFDPKGDLDPIEFVATEEQLTKAASTIGPVYDLMPLPGGSFHSAFRFETSEGSFVLRVPHDERLAEGLLVESWAAQVASNAHFPTTIPVMTDVSRYLTPFSFQILHYLEGPSEAMRLGRMARLHDITLDGYGPIDPRSLDHRPRGLFDSWEGYLTTRLDDHLRVCVEIGAMSDKEAERAEDLIRGFTATFDPVLLHNDLSPRNIIDNRVIDWESCIAGDPIFDYASQAAFYADREPLWGAFHVKGPDAPRRFWTYYLRIALARTVHRFRFGIKDNPKYPGASRRIQMALAEHS